MRCVMVKSGIRNQGSLEISRVKCAAPGNARCAGKSRRTGNIRRAAQTAGATRSARRHVAGKSAIRYNQSAKTKYATAARRTTRATAAAFAALGARRLAISAIATSAPRSAVGEECAIKQ